MNYVYGFFDTLSGRRLNTLLVEPNDACALRSATALIPTNMIKSVQLLRIGVYNLDTGLLEATDLFDLDFSERLSYLINRNIKEDPSDEEHA